MADISIIIPVFNAELYIEDCLNSILQNTNPNIEILLIDDGSIDRSNSICNYYAQKDKRIRVYSQINGGVSKARNIGIDISNGHYVTFIDSDDWIDHRFLDLISNDDFDLYCSGVNKCFANMTLYDTCPDCSTRDEVEINNMIFKMNDNYTLSQMCAKIFKRSIIDKYNIRFNEKISLGEDTEFVCSYFKYVNSMKYSSECMYYYRLEDSNASLSSKFRMNMCELKNRVFKNIRNLYIYRNIYTEENREKIEAQYLTSVVSGIKMAKYIPNRYSLKEKIAYINSFISNKDVKNSFNKFGKKVLPVKSYYFLSIRPIILQYIIVHLI